MADRSNEGSLPPVAMAFSTDQLAEIRGAIAAGQTAERGGVELLDRQRFGASDAAAAQPPYSPPADAWDGADDDDDGELLRPEDRRRAPRLRERCNAAVFRWDGNRAGAAFAVTIEDISTAGVGIVHGDRMEVGQQYLLEIPRLRRPPLIVRFTVVQCTARAGGLFDVQVAPLEVLSITAAHALHRPCDDADTLPPQSRLERLQATIQWLGRLARAPFVKKNKLGQDAQAT